MNKDYVTYQVPLRDTEEGLNEAFTVMENMLKEDGISLPGRDLKYYRIRRAWGCVSRMEFLYLKKEGSNRSENGRN